VSRVAGMSESQALAHLRANRTLVMGDIIAIKRQLAAANDALERLQRRLCEIDHGIETLEEER
jgi:hypothetical protein